MGDWDLPANHTRRLLLRAYCGYKALKTDE